MPMPHFRFDRLRPNLPAAPLRTGLFTRSIIPENPDFTKEKSRNLIMCSRIMGNKKGSPVMTLTNFQDQQLAFSKDRIHGKQLNVFCRE